MNKDDFIIWDAHACPTLEIGADLATLFEYKDQGFNFVSLNVGFDPQKKEEILKLLHYFNKYISEHSSNFTLAKNTQDIKDAIHTKKLAIAFDIEGISPLEDSKETLSLFYQLGVRQIALAYNKNNSAGGGCQDNDSGLTELGYELIKEMNTIGITIDCSHVGYQTSLNIMDASKSPVIFSHSNPYTVCNHPRNIKDEQIIACAETSGVVGINGISLFLANEDISANNIVDHINYIYQLTGPNHVGLGFDYVFDHEKTLKLVELYPDEFPNKKQYFRIKMISPKIVDELYYEMKKRKYPESDIYKIMGGNFLRVATESWCNS